MKSITYPTMEKLIIEFSEKKHAPFKKSTVKNLFLKTKSKSKDYDEASFAFIIKELSISAGGSIDEVVYAESVKQTVKSYQSSKQTAIDLMKLFTAYLERMTGMRFPITYPPIPLNSSFERLMYISKYLQNPDAEISKLQDILWISSRTIEDDLAKLRGMDGNPIQICGRKYIIDDLTRENDHIRDMASTPHPFFLTCNLTEVLVILKGLKTMAENPALKGYAMKTASEIWEQLSDMAKNRMDYVTSQLMPDEADWFKSLGNMGENTFWPEYACSRYGDNCVLECLKNGLPCYIEYREEKGSRFIHADKVCKLYGHTVIVRQGTETIELELDRIVRSSKTPEGIL